jgi:Xaa-Pro aminopeptidase
MTSPSSTHPALFSTRRQQLAQALLAANHGAGCVAIVPTAPARMRNRDSDFLYRHDSYFYYLTGFTEPDAWLVLQVASNGVLTTTLFCQPKDLEREIWDGFRLGVEAAPAALGVDAAFSVAELETRLPELLHNQSSVAYPFGTHEGLDARVGSWLTQVRARSRMGVLCPSQQFDLCALLDDMRLIKDAAEQDTMRRAAQISAQAHIRAMQRSAAGLRAGEDLREYHLDAELMHEFRRHGSQAVAYNSIVAAGANACVLHYRADAASIRSGDLVLIDAGCELDGYASDITRTFPANGRFSGPQRDLYELVLAAQHAAVAATRPGARFVDGHTAAVRVLAQGMLDVGLLNAQTHGSLDDVIEQRAYSRFYMHRTGHWLGLDVHDCGSYIEPSQAHQVTLKRDPVTGNEVQERPSRILQAGMVLTIEPGIYVRPSDDVPQAFHDIGIRIEDDALVTPAGCELISRDVPVTVSEIEALMRAS